MRDLVLRLMPLYDEGEARAIVCYVLETVFGLTAADIYGGTRPLPTAALEPLMQRLERGEPVQYVTGTALFCGRRFSVEPGVLIPRPETEDLCRWIVGDESPRHILDIGTGSGCIAVTLALDTQAADTTAWDISATALAVARRNATALGADIRFVRRDMLEAAQERDSDKSLFDLIVSNPPYICDSEKASMHVNVLDYEPHEALFVPDDAPLLYYAAVARYARRALIPGGRLYLEANPLTLQRLTDMLHDEGFTRVETRDDSYGRRRFVRVEIGRARPI